MHAPHQVHNNDRLQAGGSADLDREMIHEKLGAHERRPDIGRLFSVEGHEQDRMVRKVRQAPGRFNQDGDRGGIVIGAQVRPSQMIIVRADQDPAGRPVRWVAGVQRSPHPDQVVTQLGGDLLTIAAQRGQRFEVRFAKPGRDVLRRHPIAGGSRFAATERRAGQVVHVGAETHGEVAGDREGLGGNRGGGSHGAQAIGQGDEHEKGRGPDTEHPLPAAKEESAHLSHFSPRALYLRR